MCLVSYRMSNLKTYLHKTPLICATLSWRIQLTLMIHSRPRGCPIIPNVPGSMMTRPKQSIADRGLKEYGVMTSQILTTTYIHFYRARRDVSNKLDKGEWQYYLKALQDNKTKFKEVSGNLQWTLRQVQGSATTTKPNQWGTSKSFQQFLHHQNWEYQEASFG